MEERAAHDKATGRGSHVFLHVAVAISLLMGVYLFAWVLPGYGRLAGAPVPELSLALSTDALGSFTHGLSSSPRVTPWGLTRMRTVQWVWRLQCFSGCLWQACRGRRRRKSRFGCY